MHPMQFVHKKDGSWGRKSFVDLIEVDVPSDEMSSKEDDDNCDIKGEGTENEIATRS